MTSFCFATGAEVLVDYRARVRRHGASERTPDVDGVMATIVAPEKLTWSRSLCWAANRTKPDGTQETLLCTTPKQVRAYYDDLLSREELSGARPGVTDIRGNWYTFSEVVGTPMRTIQTGEIHQVDSAVISLFDGGEGVSAEICWFRCADAPSDAGIRAQAWAAYIGALRQQDVPALLSLMSDNMQGAVREYVDADPPFVAVDGREAMGAHYEKLFAHLEIQDIEIVRLAIRGWYVFCELRWTVRLLTGPEAGKDARFLTVEHMAYDEGGLFQSRFGYGTEMADFLRLR